MRKIERKREIKNIEEEKKRNNKSSRDKEKGGGKDGGRSKDRKDKEVR